MSRPIDERGLPEGYEPHEQYEISPREAAAKRARARETGESFLLLDVREAEEVAAASIEGAVHIPLGELKSRLNELDVDEETTIAVFCHGGVRSFDATVYMHQEGLTGARSIVGGIDLWSRVVDPGVPRY